MLGERLLCLACLHGAFCGEQVSPYLPSRGKRNLQRTFCLGFCSCTTFSQPYKLQPYYIESCLLHILSVTSSVGSVVSFPHHFFPMMAAPLWLKTTALLSPAIQWLLELKPREPWFCHFLIHSVSSSPLPDEITFTNYPLLI